MRKDPPAAAAAAVAAAAAPRKPAGCPGYTSGRPCHYQCHLTWKIHAAAAASSAAAAISQVMTRSPPCAQQGVAQQAVAKRAAPPLRGGRHHLSEEILLLLFLLLHPDAVGFGTTRPRHTSVKHHRRLLQRRLRLRLRLLLRWQKQRWLRPCRVGSVGGDPFLPRLRVLRGRPPPPHPLSQATGRSLLPCGACG